jgi:ankyrin repeat protein
LRIKVIETFLFYQASIQNHRETVEFFIEKNCDVNEKNSDGNTPLHLGKSHLYFQ